eukprot:scaffold462_cov167-Skeletonema_marinoi.AAC.2
MEEAFQRNGSAAGDPSVLYSHRVGILDAIRQGRLDDIAILVHAYLNLVNANYAVELSDTYGDVVYKVAEAEEYEEADVILFNEMMMIIDPRGPDQKYNSATYRGAGGAPLW